MIKLVICSLCSISDALGFVDLAAKANTHDDSNEGCAFEDGLDLTCFVGAGVRLATNTYDGQAGDEQIAGNENVIFEWPKVRS